MPNKKLSAKNAANAIKADVDLFNDLCMDKLYLRDDYAKEDTELLNKAQVKLREALSILDSVSDEN